MLYPVRIFNQSGKLKKEVSTQSLSKRYWKKFFDPDQKNLQVKPKGLSKKQLDEYYGLEYDRNMYSDE